MSVLWTATDAGWTERESYATYEEAMDAAREFMKLYAAVDFRIITSPKVFA